MSTVAEDVKQTDVHGINGKVGAQLPPSTRHPHRTGMQKDRIAKYRPAVQINLPDRQWPNRVIDKAPIWCSVDLRDGNQALAIPMSVAEKMEMFETLVEVGFKQIEVGFPSASQIEFDFIRKLIEEDRIPDDVTIQVLVQSRRDLIERTFESLRGVKRAIVHMYNATAPAWRQIVFGMEKSEVINLAVSGTRIVRECSERQPDTEWMYEYSPETFSLTEVEFSLEVCEAVCEAWGATAEKPIILNLPATVEVATPNVHADQIEWFCRNMKNRQSAIISLHTHNDRGTGVAATELGLLAGADRVEGTLFGNGERTGNVDIVTVALNMYTQGVESGLDFSDIETIREVYERCTRLEVPIRQPYAGELVFTAFSGSHQDAINKGMARQAQVPDGLWQVPYLPIDPKDIGRSYEAIIRINSQSGKGGVAYVMENEFGFELPKAMRREFGKIINDIADEKGEEISSKEIYQAFVDEYLDISTPYQLQSFHTETKLENGQEILEGIAVLNIDGGARTFRAAGNGPIDCFVVALQQANLANFDIASYAEHSLGKGAEARAVAYIQIKTSEGENFFGAATDTNIELASIKAVLSAVNRSLRIAMN